jgi:hypothetical protein
MATSPSVVPFPIAEAVAAFQAVPFQWIENPAPFPIPTAQAFVGEAASAPYRTVAPLGALGLATTRNWKVQIAPAEAGVPAKTTGDATIPDATSARTNLRITPPRG